jgi:hypothetical protein
MNATRTRTRPTVRCLPRPTLPSRTIYQYCLTCQNAPGPDLHKHESPYLPYRALVPKADRTYSYLPRRYCHAHHAVARLPCHYDLSEPKLAGPEGT